MPALPSNPTPPPRRNFWQRRVRDPIVVQLTQGITPEKIALTIAVGSACALFPILGTTTLLCFLIGLALRLNQPIIQLINQALWPVHVTVIVLCVHLGEMIFGVPRQRFFVREMRAFWDQPAASFWSHLMDFIHRFGPTAWHAIVAWAVLAPFYIAVVYYVSLLITREVVFLKHKVETGEVKDTPPPTP